MQIQAVAMDGSNEALERIFQYFGVETTVPEPVIRIINIEKMSKYQYEGALEVSALKAWVTDYLDGE